MRRLRGLLSLVILLAVETVALATMWWAVHVPEWHVDWTHFGRWLDASPRSDVAIALAAWGGLALAGWLALTTSLYLLAVVSRVPGLIRATSLLTVPGVRRVVEGVAALSITAAVVLPGTAAFAQAPAGGWARPPAATAAPAPAPTPPAAETVTIAPAVAPTESQVGQWTVAPGDNLWDISAEVAAHQLGVSVDSLTPAQIAPYWQQVIDLTMPHLRSGDANLIYAGEVVVLAPMMPTGSPADITVAPPAPAPAPAPVVTPVPAVTSVPAPVTAVTPPEAAAPTAVAPATTVATTVAPATTAAPADTADSSVAPAVDLGQPASTEAPSMAVAARSSSHASTWAGGGLLSAALVIALSKRRARGARVRKPGEILVPAAREAMETERRARVAADPEAVPFVDAALRALAAVVSEPVPEPIGFLLSRDTLTVVLAHPGVAPAPFRGRGTTWSIPRSSDLEELASIGSGYPMIMPAVVTLGKNDAGEEVVVDLENTGMLSIVGPGANEVVNAAAIQLATAPWTTLVEVILVGFAAPPSGPTVRAVSSVAEVIDELEDRAERTATLLADENCRTTLMARMSGVADDTWVPTVVVCAAPPPDHLARRLVGLVDSPEAAGIAALVAGPMPDPPWEARITGEGLNLKGFETTVRTLQQVSDADAADICDVLTAAAQDPVPVLAAEVEPRPTEPKVVVNVYGAVTVSGIPEATSPDRELTKRGKSLEVAVYLACHPKAQLDGDRVMEALWPGCDRAATRNTFSTTMWHLRQAAGREHFPTLRGRFYAANPDTVVTTPHLIEQALVASRDQPRHEAMAGLREALRAVEGRPFEMSTSGGHGGGRSLSAWEWAFAENTARWAAEVAGDAAHRLHQLALDDDDPDTAAWAVRQGLRADPESEQLRRDEMAVARARRSLADLETALHEAERTAAVDDGVVDPVTMAVYREARDALEDDAEFAAVAG